MANQQLGLSNEDKTLTFNNEVGHSYSPIFNIGGTGNSATSSYNAGFDALFANDQDAKQESTGSVGLGFGGDGSGGSVSKGGDSITDTPLISALTENKNYIIAGICIIASIFIISRILKKKAK